VANRLWTACALWDVIDEIAWAVGCIYSGIMAELWV
jgi:hypothetical protein